MNVYKTIVKSLNKAVFLLTKNISEQCEMSHEELLKIWCEQQELNFQTEFSASLKISNKQVKIVKDKNECEEKVKEESFVSDIKNEEDEEEENKVEEKKEVEETKEEEEDLEDTKEDNKEDEGKKDLEENKEEESSIPPPCPKKVVKSSKPKKTSPPSNSNKCTYIITKGVKKGEECGAGCKGDAIFCSKHNK